MPARVHPVIKWEVDWAGDGTFSHAAADITPWFTQAVLDGGSDLNAFVSQPSFATTSGSIRLNNSTGRFNFIGGMIETANLIRSRLIRRMQDGVVSAIGRCQLDTAALAENPTEARLVITSRADHIFRKPLDVNRATRNTPLTALFAALQREESVQLASDPGYTLLDVSSAVRSGPIYYKGPWDYLLDITGNMMAGWWVEDIKTGTIRFYDLDSLLAATPVADFPVGSFERSPWQQGGALIDTVTNQATFESRFLEADTETRQLASLQFTGEAGKALDVFFEQATNELVRGVLWDVNPIRADVAHRALPFPSITSTTIRVALTPTASGPVTVGIFGRLLRAVPGYKLVDAQKDRVDYQNSVKDFGLADLELPPWQADPLHPASITKQRRFLRQRYRPLILVVAEWSGNQITQAQADSLRDNAVPGKVVNIGDDKVFIMSVRLADTSTGASRRIVRSIRLGARTGNVPDLPNIPSTPDVPPIRLPDDQDTPNVPTDTGNDNVDDALELPPGADSCSFLDGITTISWPSDSWLRSSPAGELSFGDRQTFTPATGQGNYYLLGATDSTVPRVILAQGLIFIYVSAVEQGAARAAFDRIFGSAVGPVPDSLASMWSLVGDSDTVSMSNLRVTEYSQRDLANNYTWRVTYDGVLPSGFQGMTRQGGGGGSSHRLMLAGGDAALPADLNAPTNSKIMLESRTLSIADMSALASRNVTIRGATLAFGAKTGDATVTVDGQQRRRVFFAGPVPTSISCASFELTGSPIVTVPTAALVGPSYAQLRTAFNITPTWSNGTAQLFRRGIIDTEETEVTLGASGAPVSVMITQDTYFRLVVTGPGGRRTSTIFVRGSAGAIRAPTVELRAPATFSANSNFNVKLFSYWADNTVITRQNADGTGPSTEIYNGSEINATIVQQIARSTKFTAVATGPGGTTTTSVTVNVGVDAAPPADPTPPAGGIMEMWVTPALINDTWHFRLVAQGTSTVEINLRIDAGKDYNRTVTGDATSLIKVSDDFRRHGTRLLEPGVFLTLTAPDNSTATAAVPPGNNVNLANYTQDNPYVARLGNYSGLEEEVPV